MKLRLLTGRTGTGKTHNCLAEMAEQLKNPAGPSLVMILPEHATFQTEQQLAAWPGLQGFARAYVFGFRRLAHRILMETGGAVRPHITDLGKRLVLAGLLQEGREEFKLLQRAAKQRNFADILAGIIQEFKAYGITPSQLQAAHEHMPHGALQDKLHDLALVYQGFESFLQGRYTDPEDYLTLLADKISQSEILRGAEIWIDGFTWFNPQEMGVVAELLAAAGQVTVTLCLDGNLSRQQSPTALFHRQWDTRRKLLELAGRLGAEVEENHLAEGRRFLAPLLGHMEKQLFNPCLAVWPEQAAGITVVEAANRRIEVEGAARDMLAKGRQGWRWRDMAIILRDAESYGSLVETVLADYDIPFFSDQKRQSLHHPLAELLRSSLDVVVENWSYDAVFRCLKSDLCSVGRDETDILENYVLEFGIRGSKWTQDVMWTFVRRYSLAEDSEISQRQQELLEKVDAIRRRAATPLATLAARLKKAPDVEAMCTAHYEFLEELHVPERLLEWADQAEERGELALAREHRQLWEGAVQLFEQLVEVCGKQKLSLAEYREMIHEGLEGLTLSLIPPGLDYVAISSMEQTSVENCKGIYVFGANDGVIPMRGRGEGLLTDLERGQMLQLGLELAPGCQQDSFAERFTVYMGLTRSREYLWLSYPLADEDGKGLGPSLLIRQLRENCRVPLAALPLEPEAGTERSYLAHGKRAVAALAGALRSCRQGEEISEIWWDVYNWALQQPKLAMYLRQAAAGVFHHNQAEPLPDSLARQLYPRGNVLRGSVTRFEAFQACPFKHFVQYGLGLKEREIFRLQAPDWGQFLHAALKLFGDRLQAEGRDWGDVSRQECSLLSSQVVEELAPRLQNEILLSSQQHKHLVQRLQRTVERAVRRLADFDRASCFKPLALEQSFGRGGELPPLVYVLSDETVLEVIGQIDRLDSVRQEGQQYILVIDYKSGGAWLKLADVYYGIRLQLLTYLLVAQKAYAGSLPAGVLYYFLKNPSLSLDGPLSEAEAGRKINDLLKMPGWVLAEQEVIQLLDKTIEGRSEFLKIAFKKDQTLYSSSLPYVKTAEEFSLLLGHVERKLVATAVQIMAGDIAISPYQLGQRTPCGFCRYGAVCQFDGLLAENEYRRLSQAKDAVIMEQISREGGVNHGLV